MKKTIGKKERISILDLELYDLDAKVDTGADSSALHCDHIEIDEKNIVHFTLLDEVHEAYHGKRMSLPLFELKTIKSSNGQVQHRPSVKVNVEFFGKIYETIISLTDRSTMKFPMLIGRRFIHKRFLVDVSKENLAKPHTNKKEKKQ